MLKRHDGQIDIFNSMIFERLIPKDHLLIKIDAFVDFSNVYDIVKESYSEIGRGSWDPLIVFKMCLLGYLYRLSDTKVIERTKTDVAFRWFLGLSLDDSLPDDSTMSRFRTNRMKDIGFSELFTDIVQQCISKDLIKTNRYIIDTTDVAANTNYPREKRLLHEAFRRVIKEVERYDALFAEVTLKSFELEVNSEKEKNEKLSIESLCQIAYKYTEEIYLRMYEELREHQKSHDAFVTLWRIIEQYSVKGSKDKIISCVDPDARIGYKTKHSQKRGYKNHIIVDEDSEIIIASEQTPFNVPDCKEFCSLLDKAAELGLKPEEVSADKAYGTIDNRAHAKDKEITSNIAFYDMSDVEYSKFDIKMFQISEDLKHAKCPGGYISQENRFSKDGSLVKFSFPRETCSQCPLRAQCLSKGYLEKGLGRIIEVAKRYDAVVRDIARNETPEFEEAYNRRYIVERRFATMVMNHGLRRCRYLRMKGARIHITMANIACNIIRMVGILGSRSRPSIAV